MIDLNPLDDWQEYFPDGFKGSKTLNIPTIGGLLCLGADVRSKPVEIKPVDLRATFADGELVVDVLAEQDENFRGIVIANYKVPCAPFNRLTAELPGMVRLRNKNEHISFKERYRRTAFGTIEEMISFALGYTSLELFAELNKT